MRVLHIHKFFFPNAGAETAMFHTRELLLEHGHEVIDFAMEHPRNVDSSYSHHFAPRRDYADGERPLVNRTRDALASVYSLSARRRLHQLLDQVRPDLVHMHLVYHQLTLSVVDEVAARDLPSVMTLHDYKIGCPAYQLYRDERPCTLCLTGPVENVVRHRCLKGSLPASLLAATEARLARSRGTYAKIDAFVAPSRFAGDVAIATGIDADTVHVVPNFLPAEEIGEPVARLAAAPRFFFAGRLETVKGVREILDAFATADPALGTLVLAGAGGGLEGEVEAAAANSPNIEYLGRLPREEVFAQLRASRAILMPVRWHENNPMSLLEARAIGVPVICTALGGLPDMVDDGVDGFVIEPGDVGALREAIRRLAGDRELAERMGRTGNRRLLRDNTPAVHYGRLMGAYGAAIEHRAHARST
jgi:glycosyltransferase involved in cell wall biosynthesis